MILYTSYYGKLKACKKRGYCCVQISRTVPRSVVIYYFGAACPSYDLLSWGKKNGLDKTYKKEYLRHLNSYAEDIMETIKMLDRVDNGVPIVFFCYEKDPLTCHRSIFADWLEEQGFGVVEEWSE